MEKGVIVFIFILSTLKSWQWAGTSFSSKRLPMRPGLGLIAGRPSEPARGASLGARGGSMPHLAGRGAKASDARQGDLLPPSPARKVRGARGCGARGAHSPRCARGSAGTAEAQGGHGNSQVGFLPLIV